MAFASGAVDASLPPPPATLDDERRRYDRTTTFGEAVARAETRRLQERVRLARASGFVPGSAS